LVELPVREFKYVVPHSIVYRKGAYLSPAALLLIEILKVQAKVATGASGTARAKKQVPR
jgi:hypothetical protein